MACDYIVNNFEITRFNSLGRKFHHFGAIAENILFLTFLYLMSLKEGISRTRNMAAWLLFFVVVLDCFSTSKVSSEKNSLIKCRSPEQETFSCHWTYGDFHNFTSPDLTKLLYMKSKEDKWNECPDYVSAGENSCYFNSTYTSIWTQYCLKLLHGNTVIVERCFSVDDIVQPDPPIDLGWTLLTSLSEIHADIQVKWDPPPSADVRKGWITLQYELQLKEVNKTKWIKMDPVITTAVPVYSLKMGRDYEVRVRCKQLSSENFGEYSEILYVSLPQPDLEESEILLISFVIVGTFGGTIVLLLIFFTKQKRLKMLILPPVPVPKIKGIDSELLKKGKLDEVNSILTCHGINKPELYNDSWVEFIELDIDDPDEKTEGLDTDRLLNDDHLKSHSCLGVKDDDSGRASCCEPDIPETDFSTSDTCDGTSDIVQLQKVNVNEGDLLCLDQKCSDESPLSFDASATQLLNSKTSGDDKPRPFVSETESADHPVCIQLTNQSSKANIDFYALVSDISPTGRLLLSPGQRIKTENEECIEPTMQCQPNYTTDSAYICESAAVTFCATPSHEEEPQPRPNFNENTYFTAESLTTTVLDSVAEDEASTSEMPVPDYTSLHIISSQQNIVLTELSNPSILASCGYMNPDQVNKFMP
nr:growth hormone receptor isoform X2 [Geotrypetes seraphini]XP_033787973.1 growth hormone receptor isoform X2 [Geotrypetes seraphini]XP_033787983.1 growth hormone receptor isoform X2 [Geotrypetes seraphini]XP_033787993.1 growth hormone receptor isoform X2 [Geotrypetes seraphini]XP_033788003.1 growth hormone receptor isoform X2 [Geotrypetes seraphini]